MMFKVLQLLPAMATAAFLFVFIPSAAAVQQGIGISNHHNASATRLNHLRSRKLHDITDFHVHLVLELQYVNEKVAQVIETKDLANPLVNHFCSSVQKQAVGAIVNAEAESESNATVTFRSNELACQVVDTRRLYDPEAVNMFGEDHLSLQVQVLQHVNVTSDQPVWLEEVVSFLETGFERNGGSTQFRNSLLDFPGFETVIAIKVRDTLSPIQEAPSSSPSIEPTPEPTHSPSAQPTQKPTPGPTVAASSLPTASPTKRPSVLPTTAPTHFPTSRPTYLPSKPPTKSWATSQPTTPSSKAPTHAQEFPDPVLSPTMWALIAGASAIALSCCIICFVFWRRRDEQDPRKQQGLATLGGNVPIVVELDDDQRSLAETTLGEQTAGRSMFKPTRTVLPHPNPRVSSPTSKKRELKKASRTTKKVRAVSKMKSNDSFDEESLYTTPFSLRPNETSYRPKISSSTPSHLEGKLMVPLDYEDNILFPMSDNNTESSDGMFSHSQSEPISVDQSAMSVVSVDSETKKRHAGSRDGPIDLDTEEPYDDYILENGDTGTLKADKGAKATKVKQAEDLGMQLDSFDGDDWSYTSGDQKPVQHSGTLPRSPSYSSKSTMKTSNNTRSFSRLARAPESIAEIEEGKKEIDDDPSSCAFENIQEYPSSPMRTTHTDAIDNFMSGSSSIELTLSPASLTSRKSIQSKKSVSTTVSRESKSTLTGQAQKYPVSDLMSALEENKQSTPNTSFQSPLMRLLEHRYRDQSRHSLPVVTPEGKEEEDSRIDDSARQNGREVDDSSQPPGDIGKNNRDDVSASTDASGVSNSWLFEKVERTLGPRSTVSDSDAFTSRTDLSKLLRMGGSEVSFGSRSRRMSTIDDMALNPRRRDNHQLETQLAALNANSTAISSITGTSIAGASSASLPSLRRPTGVTSNRKRIVVAVPPGKLGVILANRHDGRGTVVAEVRHFSSLHGMLSPGDCLVAVDEFDCTKWEVSKIISLMASRSDKVRRLTVVTTIQQQHSGSATNEPRTRVVF